MTGIIILGLLLILIIGFIDVFKDVISIKKQIDFFIEFRDKFIQLANSYLENNSLDNELYHWLTKKSSKAQSDMGINGLMDYRPAFSNLLYKNYQFVVNTLPQFRTGEINNSDISAMDDMLVRYIGIMEEWQSARIKKIKNPFIWFRIGMQFILSIPVYILFWLGIIGNKSKNRLIYNVIFKIFVGITSLVTLLSGIVTIIVGKDKLFDYIQTLLR